MSTAACCTSELATARPDGREPPLAILPFVTSGTLLSIPEKAISALTLAVLQYWLGRFLIGIACLIQGSAGRAGAVPERRRCVECHRIGGSKPGFLKDHALTPSWLRGHFLAITEALMRVPGSRRGG